MNKIDLIETARLRDDLPEFRPGDTVKVHVRVVEGSRERIQVFQGVVIRRQGSGMRPTAPETASVICLTIWSAPAARTSRRV